MDNTLVADVFNALIQKDDGTLIASTTLAMADINFKQNEKEVRGGQGDNILAILHSARDVDIKTSDMIFRKDWIAQQLGTSETTGAVTAWALPKYYTAVSNTGIKITLDHTPLATNSGLKLFKTNGTELVVTTDYTISGATVTLLYVGAAGDIIEVRGYKYTTGSTATSLDINSSSFATGAVFILETLELNTDETPLAKIQYIFDEVLPSGNFSIQTKKEKDATVSEFTFRAIKPANQTSIGRMIRIPLS